MNIAMPTGLGAVLAILVLVAAFVLFLTGRMDLIPAALFGMLAVARLC